MTSSRSPAKRQGRKRRTGEFGAKEQLRNAGKYVRESYVYRAVQHDNIIESLTRKA